MLITARTNPVRSGKSFPRRRSSPSGFAIDGLVAMAASGFFTADNQEQLKLLSLPSRRPPHAHELTDAVCVCRWPRITSCILDCTPRNPCSSRTLGSRWQVGWAALGTRRSDGR